MTMPTANIDNDEFTAMVMDEATDVEIAKAFGINKRTASQRRHKLGLPSWTGLRRARIEKQIRKLHKANLSDLEIALCTGLGPVLAQRERRALGLEPNRPFLPKGLPPAKAYERKIERNRQWQARQEGKDISDITPRPKQVKAVKPPKIELRERVRPIARALGNIYAKTPDVDVQAALAVAMQRHAADPVFAAAWALEVRA